MNFSQVLSNLTAFLKTSKGKTVVVASAFVLLSAGALLATMSGKSHSSVGSTSSSSPTPGASASGGASPTALASPGSTPGVRASGGAVALGPGGTVIGYGGKPIPADVGPHTTASGFTYNPANLYSGAANYQGITPTTITICVHAAISLGPAFNETANDVLTYWRYINAHGGVLGRQVNVTIEDDQYTAQGAQIAAQRCQDLNPMFVMGGIGFDQDPVVRTLAEQNKFLYLYTMADDGSQGGPGGPKPYQYSFTGAPTIEQVGNWMGQVAVHQNQGPYGAVYVNDGNWIGGYNTYKAYLESHGVDKTAFENQSYTMGAGGDVSQFSTYVTKLKLAGVKTVYLWMNALGAGSFVQTAKSQNYFPAYVTPDAFDLFTGEAGESMDTGSASVKPALAGWITPAFDPNYQNVPYWSAEKQMLDAYKNYDGGHLPDDIDWQSWLGFESIADMLTQCGINCSRNDIAGMFNSGWAESLNPLCPTNFGPNHNFGGQFMNLYEATRVPYVSPDYNQLNQHTVWRQVTTCSNKFN